MNSITIRPAVIIAALLATSGCAKAIDVPRDQFEAVSHTQMRAHVIRTAGGETYEASSFSVTDSTLVIAKLNPSDARYGKATLPMSLPLEEVESLHSVDQRPAAFWIGVGMGALILGIATLASFGY